MCGVSSLCPRACEGRALTTSWDSPTLPVLWALPLPFLASAAFSMPVPYLFSGANDGMCFKGCSVNKNWGPSRAKGDSGSLGLWLGGRGGDT